MAKSAREFQQNPKYTVSLPEGGKVTGDVEFSVIRRDRIYITSDLGYSRPDNYVHYRGQDFRVSHLRAFLHSNGEWHTHEEGETAMNAAVYKRNGFLVDVPPSFAAAIVGTILDSIPSNVTPDILKRAEWVSAYNDETSAMESVAKARAALESAELEREAVSARRRAAEQS